MEQTLIISPWVFYAIDLLTTFRAMFIISFVLSLVVLLVTSLFYTFDFYCENDTYLVDKNDPRYKSLRTSSIILLISLIILILIPKESTIYKMLIVNETTYEQVDEVVKIIDNKTDEIIEALK